MRKPADKRAEREERGNDIRERARSSTETKYMKGGEAEVGENSAEKEREKDI